MEEKKLDKFHSNLFISFGTIFGFIVFALILSSFILLEVTKSNPFTDRMTSAVLGLTIITFLIGVIIDQLKYRNFRFWALGAFVSFLGVLLLFSPVLFYGIGNNDHLFWILLIIIGSILILFGYSIEAYELNNKVAKILINLWENFRNFQWKKIPGKILNLFGLILYGILFYIGLGLKKFNYVLRRSFSALFIFTAKSFGSAVKLLVALPGYAKNTAIFCYEYNYLLIIPLFLFTGLKLVNFSSSLSFLLVMAFLLVLLVLMAILQSNEELSRRYLQTLRTRSWEALQSISIKIQQTTSSVGRYRCQNCNSPLKLGQEHCDVCEYRVKQCSICKLPIKKDQAISICSHCQYPAHTNHWDQWIRMNNNCPICKL